MAVSTNEILKDWKSAEACAREAERQLAAAWDRYEQTRRDPPDPELFAEVGRRREIARDRLNEAVRVLRRDAAR